MANYDYKCKECGERVEVSHGMNEKPEVKCPKCGKECAKCISKNMRFTLKGGGFYKSGSF